MSEHAAEIAALTARITGLEAELDRARDELRSLVTEAVERDDAHSLKHDVPIRPPSRVADGAHSLKHDVCPPSSRRRAQRDVGVSRR